MFRVINPDPIGAANERVLIDASELIRRAERRPLWLALLEAGEHALAEALAAEERKLIMERAA